MGFDADDAAMRQRQNGDVSKINSVDTRYKWPQTDKVRDREIVSRKKYRYG